MDYLNRIPPPGGGCFVRTNSFDVESLYLYDKSDCLDYVVAQMGLNNRNIIYATDYMLETVSFVYYLLFINAFYLYKLDYLPLLFKERRPPAPLSSDTSPEANLTVSNVNNYPESVNSPPTSPAKIYYALNPWFVTGFADAEGCFLINITSNSKMKTGYSIDLAFKIGLHSKDSALVKELRNFFGVGSVTDRSKDAIQY